MERKEIRATKKTPRILLDPNGLIEFEGYSFLENTKSFYEPVVEWLKEYIIHPAEKTEVNFKMDFFNTSSQLWIFMVVEILIDLEKVGKDIVFNWYYKEEEVEEAGEDLANLLNVKMNFIKLAE
jgi:hypothetical protein